MLSSKMHNNVEKDEISRNQRIKRDEYKREIEAILFAARRILKLDEICEEFKNLEKNEILELMYELIEEYILNGSALEVVELSDYRFEMKIRDNIVNSIDKFTMGSLLKKSDIKTLALITFLQPSADRQILYQYLGKTSTVYNSIRNLKKLRLIHEKNKNFSLTQYFYDYFQLNTNDPDLINNLLKNINENFV